LVLPDRCPRGTFSGIGAFARKPDFEEPPMNFSALTGNDRTAAIAAVIVIITGVISLAWRWGFLMFLPLLAGLVVLFVLFQTQVAPNTKLPMSKGMTMLIAGGAAALFWVLVTLQWLGYISENFASIDVIQFLVGLVASIVLLFAGFRAYQAESGAAPAAPPPAPPAEPPAAPPSA
jgi:hypothetical protein